MTEVAKEVLTFSKELYLIDGTFQFWRERLSQIFKRHRGCSEKVLLPIKSTGDLVNLGIFL